MAAGEDRTDDIDILKDVYVCIVFLTRVPTPPWPEAASRPLGAASWAFPVAGAVVAIVAAVVYGFADLLGCPPAVSAVAAIGAGALVTGALHEDGLSDFADGIWGGATPARRLEIMSDSRVGAFGAIALILSIGGRAAAVAAIADPTMVLGALIAAGAASRGALPVLLAQMPAAKSTGLGAGAGAPDFTVWLLGIVVAVVIVAFAAPGGWLASLLGAAAGAALVGWVARRALGGQTGDVLGAAQQAAEFAALALIAAAVTQAG